MFTSIIGYPRVGAQRELKFATEKYFKNEITADELQQTAKNIRKEQWETLQGSSLDMKPQTVISGLTLQNIIRQNLRKAVRRGNVLRQGN